MKPESMSGFSPQLFIGHDSIKPMGLQKPVCFEMTVMQMNCKVEKTLKHFKYKSYQGRVRV